MKKAIAFSVLLLLFNPMQSMAKSYKSKKWSDSHVDSRLRGDGKKDILIGPRDSSQERGIKDKTMLNGREIKAHSHIVIGKDGKVSYMRILPSKETASLMKKGDKGIVVHDDKGESHIMKIIRK
jgi:hypothetical protein